MSEPEEMLEYMYELISILDGLDVGSSMFQDKEQLSLAWYDDSDARNALAIWLDDCTGHWSVVKNGNVLESIEFTGIEEFKEFTIT